MLEAPRARVQQVFVFALICLPLLAGCGGHNDAFPPAPHIAVLTLNAGTPTVAVYTVGANGALTLGGSDAGPATPSAGTLDATRTHLYVSDAQSNAVFGYAIGAGGA